MEREEDRQYPVPELDVQAAARRRAEPAVREAEARCGGAGQVGGEGAEDEDRERQPPAASAPR